MATDSIQFLLNNFAFVVIENITFDVLRHRIVFDTRHVWNGQVTRPQLIFEEVASHYFLHDVGEARRKIDPYEEDDMLEMSSIDYYPDGIGAIGISTELDWPRKFTAAANFAIEIWDRMLFIEAAVVIIDGQRHHVGYPE